MENGSNAPFDVDRILASAANETDFSKLAIAHRVLRGLIDEDSPCYEDLIAPLLSHEAPWIREASLRVYSSPSRTRMINAVKTGFKDPAPDVRLTALTRADELATVELVFEVQDLLGDASDEVVNYAASLERSWLVSSEMKRWVRRPPGKRC